MRQPIEEFYEKLDSYDTIKAARAAQLIQVLYERIQEADKRLLGYAIANPRGSSADIRRDELELILDVEIPVYNAGDDDPEGVAHE